MTVTHVGSTKQYSQSWDNIFQGKSGKAMAKPTAKKPAEKPATLAAKKANKKAAKPAAKKVSGAKAKPAKAKKR